MATSRTASGEGNGLGTLQKPDQLAAKLEKLWRTSDRCVDASTPGRLVRGFPNEVKNLVLEGAVDNLWITPDSPLKLLVDNSLKKSQATDFQFTRLAIFQTVPDFILSLRAMLPTDSPSS